MAHKILVVEDNSEFRELLSIILDRAGYEVALAEDGVSGLERARTEKPDLILTDIQMPRLDGFGLTRAVRAEPGIERTPIILISVLSSPEQIVEGLKLGADDYVNKPFNSEEVLARVGSLLRQAGDAAGRP